MIFHLVAHMLRLVSYGRRTAAIYYIITLYYHSNRSHNFIYVSTLFYLSKMINKRQTLHLNKQGQNALGQRQWLFREADKSPSHCQETWRCTAAPSAVGGCCCCRPHSTNVLPAESSTRIMWQPTVSPPRWQGKAPLCRDSSRGPG